MKPKHAVVAMDASAFREELATAMTRAGYEVVRIAEEDRVLKALAEGTPDVLVVGERLLEPLTANGLSGASEICKRCAVIVIADSGDDHCARKAYEAGALDYLCLPLCPESLLARLEDARQISRAETQDEKCVSEIMLPIEEYTCIQASSSVQQALTRLKEASGRFVSTGLVMESGHRALLVFEGEGLVGVLPVRNLIRALLPDYLQAADRSGAFKLSGLFWRGMFSVRLRSLKAMRVRDIMNPRPPLVPHDASLMQAAFLLCEEKRRRVVVSRNGKIVGVVREQELFHEISRLVIDRRR